LALVVKDLFDEYLGADKFLGPREVINSQWQSEEDPC
jgi:hypothetical protein